MVKPVAQALHDFMSEKTSKTAEKKTMWSKSMLDSSDLRYGKKAVHETALK